MDRATEKAELRRLTMELAAARLKLDAFPIKRIIETWCEKENVRDNVGPRRIRGWVLFLLFIAVCVVVRKPLIDYLLSPYLLSWLPPLADVIAEGDSLRVSLWFFKFAGVGMLVLGLITVALMMVGSVATYLIPARFSASRMKNENSREVPDSLLSEIADSYAVPTGVKAKLAKRIVEDGRITFSELLSLEEQAQREIAQAAENKSLRELLERSGYQKIAAFKGAANEAL